MGETTKKIGILTTFRSYDKSYSLCIVAADQIKMLVDFGYKPVVFVTERFPKEDIFANENVEIRELPDQTRSNSVMIDSTFEEDMGKLIPAMEKGFADIDVMLTHDIVYQPDALKHNIAARYVSQNMPNLKWLHWIHSATPPYDLSNLRTSFRDMYHNVISSPFPNSHYVFFNHYSIPRIAQNFHISEQQVKIVHHPTDFINYAGYDEITKKIIKDKQLLNADFVAVYPIRLDTGKQVEVVIKTMGAIKKLGQSVRCVIIDLHSSSDDPKDPKFIYRKNLRTMAEAWGLSPQECFFTSQLYPELKVSAPRKVVADLFDISNVFIMPSRSESYSLITQEAAMRGNLLVLNEDFPPFRDIFGSEAIFRKFGSEIDILTGLNGRTDSHPSNGDGPFFDGLAREIIAKLNTYQERTRRRLLRDRTPEAVFRRELEPLLN